MTEAQAIAAARGALTMVLIISSPMLIAGLVVGLTVSVFQTTTSIQEQTLTFVPKMIAILGATIIFGPWMLRTMTSYIVQLVLNVASAGPQ